MKKLLFGLMISAVVAGLLAACGGVSTPVQSPSREGTATPTAARLERVTLRVPTCSDRSARDGSSLTCSRWPGWWTSKPTRARGK